MGGFSGLGCVRLFVFVLWGGGLQANRCSLHRALYRLDCLFPWVHGIRVLGSWGLGFKSTVV